MLDKTTKYDYGQTEYYCTYHLCGNCKNFSIMQNYCTLCGAKLDKEETRFCIKCHEQILEYDHENEDEINDGMCGNCRWNK